MAGPGSARGAGERFLLVAASAVVVVAGLKAAASLLVPFVLSLFLAVISLPLLQRLRRWRVPTAPAVLLTLVALVAGLALVALVVSGSVQGFAESLPAYRARLNELAAGAAAWLAGHGLERLREDLAQSLRPDTLVDMAVQTARGAARALQNLALVLLTVVFLLVEAAGLPAKVAHAFGLGREETERLGRVVGEVQRYLAIKTAVSLATGLAIGILVGLLGVDFPVLWGLVAFLLNYIPNIGSILAALPPVALALVQHGPGRALAVGLGFLGVNLLFGNLVEPSLMGRRLGLSTLVVFLSLVFWGWVWGPVGMLLSVPLTMALKILLENTEDARWAAALLDARAPPPDGS